MFVDQMDSNMLFCGISKNIFVTLKKKFCYFILFFFRKQCGCGNELSPQHTITGNFYAPDSKCQNSCNSGNDKYCGGGTYGAVYTITNSTGILC